MIRSPTLIGWRNCRSSTAAVTSRRARVAMAGDRAGDVDQVHDRAAEDEARAGWRRWAARPAPSRFPTRPRASAVQIHLFPRQRRVLRRSSSRRSSACRPWSHDGPSRSVTRSGRSDCATQPSSVMVSGRTVCQRGATAHGPRAAEHRLRLLHLRHELPRRIVLERCRRGPSEAVRACVIDGPRFLRRPAHAQRAAGGVVRGSVAPMAATMAMSSDEPADDDRASIS